MLKRQILLFAISAYGITSWGNACIEEKGLKDVKGGLHILRKTFATRLYDQGVWVEVIAAYIGDLE